MHEMEEVLGKLVLASRCSLICAWMRLPLLPAAHLQPAKDGQGAFPPSVAALWKGQGGRALHSAKSRLLLVNVAMVAEGPRRIPFVIDVDLVQEQ